MGIVRREGYEGCAGVGCRETRVKPSEYCAKHGAPRMPVPVTGCDDCPLMHDSHCNRRVAPDAPDDGYVDDLLQPAPSWCPLRKGSLTLELEGVKRVYTAARLALEGDRPELLACPECGRLIAPATGQEWTTCSCGFRMRTELGR